MNIYEKYVKPWNQTPKGKFMRQKTNARQRGVLWDLTFEEWWSIWEKSGKWEERGTGYKNYCMARKHDDGGYTKNNVSIITNRQNNQFSYKHTLGLEKDLL